MGDKKRLGDKIEEVIEKVMPKTAKKFKERGCGCESRKDLINRADKFLRG